MWKDKKQQKIFFDTYFSRYENTGNEYVTLRFIGEGKPVVGYYKYPQDKDVMMIDIEKYVGKYHVFFGVCPHNSPDGTQDTVSTLVAFWVDIDAKHHGNSMELVQEQISKFKLEPTIIVQSGSGLHAYWLLDNPVKITDANREELYMYSRALHTLVGGDNTVDLSRLLRVPGTPNIKSANGKGITTDATLWKECKIQKSSFIYYDLKTIVENLPDIASIEKESSDVTIDLSQPTSIKNLDDLKKLINNHPILKDAEHKSEKDGEDFSNNDFKVATTLYELGLTDADVFKAFKIFEELGWDAGNKLSRRGDSYLIKWTLKKAKAKADKFLRLLDEIRKSTLDAKINKMNDCFALIGNYPEMKQQAALRMLQDAMGGQKMFPIGQLRKALANYKINQIEAGEFFKANESGVMQFVPQLMGEYIIKTVPLMFLDGTLYRYDNGVFRRDGEEFLNGLIQSQLKNSWRSARAMEVIDYIKKNPDVAYIQENLPKTNLINVKNGMLDVNTGKLEPHSPNFKSLIQYDVMYDPDADDQNYHYFMNSVFRHEDIPTVEEFMGYIFEGKMQLKKLLILLGDKHAGKSKFIRMLAGAIGENNIAYISMQELTNNRFAMINLYGKAVNLYADLPQKAMDNTENIKLLTGDDKISGEEKYKSHKYFENTARLVFSCNAIPLMSKYDDQFIARLLIVKCPNAFVAGVNADMNITEKISTESVKSTLFNRAILGIKRLWENKQFSESDTMREELTNLIMDNDSVTAFLSENIVKELGSYEDKNVLYAVYRDWCKTNGRIPVSNINFVHRAKASPNFLDEARPRIEGKQVRAWKDVKLTSNAVLLQYKETVL